MIDASVKERLLDWYGKNRRDLPWRRTRDPYSIWISETMLQQTTTQAVIPFFERFLKRFPDVKSLAKARLEDVFEVWAGLGYYSRARNLHKAATRLAEIDFPSGYEELLDLPGFGPYTARAVSSIAFGEPVGVLDGNVIRVLSRFHDLPLEWWRTRARKELQSIADQWVEGVESREMNQALMEIGATVCLPQNPACLLCPLHASCRSRENNTLKLRPLRRPRRDREIWIWQPSIVENRGRILLCRNSATPFLRNQWLLPGPARRLKKPPKKFHFRHSITHHDIFVTIKSGGSTIDLPTLEKKWVLPSELSRHVPASLVQKALSVHRRR